jgi:hypothetical protein
MRKNTEAQVSGGVADGSEEGSVMGLERSSDVVPIASVGQPGNGEEPARAVKPFGIAKRVVWEAYRHVKANRGAAGIDGESMEMFEANLKDNLYRVWNRMSSGSYMPPAIRLVEIPKKTGGVRALGIATIEDRIAQTVAKTYIEPALEQLFHPDSYGYRPNKSALQAVGVTRERCWKYDWAIEFDIHKAFDELAWSLLLRAVRKHVKERWAVLYIERWLKGVSRQRTRVLVGESPTEVKRLRPRSVGGAVARNQNGEALRQDALKGVCAKHQVATTSERRCSLVTRFSGGRAGLLAREGSRGRVARVRCGGLHRRGSSGDMVR